MSKDMSELKHARSRAELIAIRQRWIQITLTATVGIPSILTCLKVFGIL